MVGQIRYLREKGRGDGNLEYLCGLTILTLPLYEPSGLSSGRLERRLEKLEHIFRKAEVSRVILPEGFPHIHRLHYLHPVTPQTFYRSIADLLAVEWLRLHGISPGKGRVALAGARLCPELEEAAHRLCPRVRALRIDVPGGEGELFARLLQREYGLPVTPPGDPVDVTLSFGGAVGDLSLWKDASGLGGLTLRAEGLDLPDGCAPQLMALLWERGSLRREDIRASNRVSNSAESLANG